MKTNFLEDNIIIVFLNHFFTQKIDFNRKEDLEQYFKTLFLRLNDIYNIEINGYYNITVYPDNYYGAIIHMEKEELEYMDLWDNQIDMRIVISKHNTFLYQVEDILEIDLAILDCGDIFYSDHQYYFLLKEKIDKIKMAKLLETSIIIYGKKAEEILHHGKKIELQIK